MKVSSPIAVTALKTVAKPFQWFANTKLMTKVCDKFEMSPEKAIALTTIASIVGKDGIGCYMYVKQSLHNEKIPEEKRTFVAALDLTNGGLMILSQLLMFFTISNKKFQNKIFGKMFKKIFSDNARKQYTTYMRSKPEYAGVSKEEIFKSFDAIKDRTKDTFSFLTSLIASTTLAKRVIVPFIATPLASYAQKKMMGDKPVKHHHSQPQTEQNINEKPDNIANNGVKSNTNLLKQGYNK